MTVSLAVSLMLKRHHVTFRGKAKDDKHSCKPFPDNLIIQSINLDKEATLFDMDNEELFYDIPLSSLSPNL